MDLGLKGKSVIVTGGASNIGRAISLTFAREGANVVICDIDAAQSEKVAKEITSLGVKVITTQRDITKLEEVQAMANEVISKLGCIDILVNNVGYDIMNLFFDTKPEFWDRVIAINYRGVLNGAKAVVPHMVERGKGAMISIGSDAGRLGEAREAVYSGTKGAVISFSKALAREVGRYGVRVNVVCPGTTLPTSPEEVGEKSAWKGLVNVPPEQLEKIKKAYPLGKIGTGQDIANAVVFLGSDVAAGHITGQTVSVSGGYSMM